MKDSEWQQMYELMDKAANLPGLSAGEKAVLAKQKLAEYGNETMVLEFVGYLAE